MMLRSEALAETLYKAWLASDRQEHYSSGWQPQPWLGLHTDERNRWREVAEAALASMQNVEDWHGKAPQK